MTHLLSSIIRAKVGRELKFSPAIPKLNAVVARVTLGTFQNQNISTAEKCQKQFNIDYARKRPVNYIEC